MKRTICLFFVFILVLTGCQSAAEPDGREFTDSTGRTVTVPETITKIAVSGPLTQIYVLPLAGDMLVGVSNRYASDAETYLPDYIFELPEIGQLYGGKGEMNLEALLAAAPDVVIDVGESKDSMADDLDKLTQQTGIPFLHIDATVETAPETYRTLGKLLNRTEKAEELASWCENTYETISAMMQQVEKKSVLYCLGDDGTNVLAEGSFHAETINLLAENVADLPDVVSQGSGNEVDLEQIMVWNPDVILFAPDSIYDTVDWQGVSAISSGNYYEVPGAPYGWLSSPPAVQRYLGMLWLGELLYPEDVPYDLQEEVTAYYQLFFGCELTDSMYRELVKQSLQFP